MTLFYATSETLNNDRITITDFSEAHILDLTGKCHEGQEKLVLYHRGYII